MRIEVNLTQQTWLDFRDYTEKDLSKGNLGKSGSFWFNFVLWFVLALIFTLLFRSVGQFHWQTAGIVFFFFAAITGLFFRNLHTLRKAYMPLEEGIFVGRHEFVFDENGIHSEGKGYRSFHSWKIVKSVRYEKGIIMIFLDKASAFIFPGDQLDNSDDFYTRINQLYTKYNKACDNPE
jgi:hypothetical protein